MSRRQQRVLLHWIPALIGIAVILAESTTMMGAANTSRWLLPIWEKLFGPVTPERWDFIHFCIRKSGHFIGYGSVSLGFFNGWRVAMERRYPVWAIRFRYAAALALACTLALASWDEWHQSFLPGRTSSIYDVGLDFCGALLAHLVLYGLTNRFRKRPRVQVQPA
ncbi:MAG TPA: VanZ family protein [Acidobacteriaceae bacterium]|nr:VanZ family protein [Acidobacteriaceae bacterium]